MGGGGYPGGPQPASAARLEPWQCLYFLPDPHGHGALRGVFSHSSRTMVSVFVLAAGREATAAACCAAISPLPAAATAVAARVKPLDASSSEEDC